MRAFRRPFGTYPMPVRVPALKRRMCLAPSQSQRDCVLQPRVARNELPWVGGPLNLNPERVPPETLNTNETPVYCHDVPSGRESSRICFRLLNAPLFSLLSPVELDGYGSHSGH